MSRSYRSMPISGLLVLLFSVIYSTHSTSQTAALPSVGLMGTATSSDGKPMEGVAISARGKNATVTTSVYTNAKGEYYFPALADGQYQVWAQAVGFEMARSERAITSDKKIQQDFVLKPLADFYKQLSGTEWADSMPADTPHDRRMRDIVHYNCSSCHLTGFVMAKRFDAAGWGIILDVMIDRYTNPGEPNRILLTAYREELIEYLSRIRGPQSYPWKLKPLPRPVGESAEVVVTEYDLPRGDDTGYDWAFNGTDWSEGIPSRRDIQLMHDAVVGKDGNVYFTDNDAPGRTVGKLDPKAGRVTSFALPDKDGLAVRTHGAAVDQKGNIWLTNGTEGAMLMFDPRTERFQRFPKPNTLSRGVGGQIVVDSKGNVWTSQSNGAFRLNPETGEYKEYKSITPGGSHYGIAVDAKDNAWVTQMGLDRLSVVNGLNGEVTAVHMLPWDQEVSAKDREIGERSGAITNAAPLYQKGPRRLGADRKGNTVWVAQYWTDRLAKIDINTGKITEYKVPSRYSHPYAAVVDKNQMVWLCLLNSDRIARFNPFTEKFTEYPLPTLGTNIRFIDVDNNSNPPAVWVGYTGSNKIARVEFRTSHAQASEAR